MNTLIFNGSPRENGDTICLINSLKESLSGDVHIINTHYTKISPCCDCRYCWQNDTCIIDDDMQQVYKLLDEVDNVVLASPLYFSQFTGTFLSVMSRLQLYYAQVSIRKNFEFKIKEKNGVLMLVGGGDGRYEPAVKTSKTLFSLMNVKSVGQVMSLNTNTMPVCKDKEVINLVKEAAHILNEMSERK